MPIHRRIVFRKILGRMALDEARVTGESVVISKRNKRTGRDIWEISRTVYLFHIGFFRRIVNVNVFIIGCCSNAFCGPIGLKIPRVYTLLRKDYHVSKYE